MTKITLQNIKAYIQGNLRMIFDKLPNGWIKQFLALPPYKREQVAYRMDVCGQTCINKCKHCHCETPGKWFSDIQCGGNKYPDMMEEKEWEQYKKDNNITIDAI